MKKCIKNILFPLSVLSLSTLVATTSTQENVPLTYTEKQAKVKKIIQSTVPSSQMTEEKVKRILGITYEENATEEEKKEIIIPALKEKIQGVYTYSKNLSERKDKALPLYKLPSLNDLINIFSFFLKKEMAKEELSRCFFSLYSTIKNIKKLLQDYLVNDDKKEYASLKEKYRNNIPQWIGADGKSFLLDMYEHGYLGVFYNFLCNQEEEQQIFVATINQPYQGKTLLMYLAQKKDLDAITMLLNCGMEHITFSTEGEPYELEEYIKNLSYDDNTCIGKRIGTRKDALLDKIKKHREAKETKQRWKKIKNRYRNTDAWKDAHGKPILFDIVEEGCLGLLIKAVHEEKEEEVVMVKTVNELYNGQTLLMYCLEKMVGKSQDNNGEHYTWEKNYFSIIKLLLSPDIFVQNIDLEVTNSEGKAFEQLVGELPDSVDAQDGDGEKFNFKQEILQYIEDYKQEQERIKQAEQQEREERERREKDQLYHTIVDRCIHNDRKDPAHHNKPILFSLYDQNLLDRAIDHFLHKRSRWVFHEKAIDTVDDNGNTLLEYCAKKNDPKTIQSILQAVSRSLEGKGYGQIKLHLSHKDPQGHDFEYYFKQIPIDHFENGQYNSILQVYTKCKQQTTQSSRLILISMLAVAGIVGVVVGYRVRKKRKATTPSQKDHLSPSLLTMKKYSLLKKHNTTT